MSTTGISSRLGPMARDFTRVRDQMADLQRQLGTGLRSTTFAGLGQDRTMSVSLRAQLDTIDSRQMAIDFVGTRLKVVDTTLSAITRVSSETRKMLDPNEFSMLTTGQTSTQSFARQNFGEMLSLLNTEVAGRYAFGGKIVDEPPVAGADLILNGDGTRAGLRQVVAERREADLGLNGRGRVGVTQVGSTISVTEDGVHGFGFKVIGLATSSTAATSAVVSGPPASASTTLTAQPQIGDSFSLLMRLPDGGEVAIEMKVGATTDVANRTFTVGATVTDTANNLRAMIDASLTREAQISLTATSAVRAARGFFDTFQGKSPERVAGPPFATATATRDGASDTVQWYTGDQAATDVRQDATARFDSSIAVSYGLRANEGPFTEILANLGAVISTDFRAGDDIAKLRHADMSARVRSDLVPKANRASVASIQIEMAAVAKTADVIDQRLTISKNALGEMLDRVEGVDKNEVAAQLLELQTRLQASYQTSAMMSRLSLVEYVR